MKARLLSLVALFFVCAATGCQTVNLCDGTGCNGCRTGSRLGGGGGGLGGAGGKVNYGHHHTRNYDGPEGPATAQVGYPYYTTRGPRDFFSNNPPSIGN